MERLALTTMAEYDIFRLIKSVEKKACERL